MGTHGYELVVLIGIARAAVEAAVSVVLNPIGQGTAFSTPIPSSNRPVTQLLLFVSPPLFHE
jgi:hypothetical protein